MGDPRNRMAQFWEGYSASELSLADKPIIELAGNRRVLIENHCGVKEYGYEKIMVQVCFGCVCVTGCHLELVRMTKEQLVICGEIHGVQLLRKEDA